MEGIIIKTPYKIIYNYLYKNPPIQLLMEDLLAIELPNGNYLDVGWYPQFNPKGVYKVILIPKDETIEDFPLLLETKSLEEVIKYVQAYEC